MSDLSLAVTLSDDPGGLHTVTSCQNGHICTNEANACKSDIRDKSDKPDKLGQSTQTGANRGKAGWAHAITMDHKLHGEYLQNVQFVIICILTLPVPLCTMSA